MDSGTNTLDFYIFVEERKRKREREVARNNNDNNIGLSPRKGKEEILVEEEYHILLTINMILANWY